MARSMMNALVGAAVASCVLVSAVDAQPARNGDPFIGVWKLNVERSVYVPGPRPPADAVTMYQFAPMPDGSTRFTLAGTNPAGIPTFQITVFRVDGRQRPVHNLATLTGMLASTQAPSVTRSYRQIDANTVEFTTYNDGVAGGTVIRQLLPDGNTYVQRPTEGTGAVLLFERVR